MTDTVENATQVQVSDFVAFLIMIAVVAGIFLVCFGYWKFLGWVYYDFKKWWKIHKKYKIGKVTHVTLSHYLTFNLVDPIHYPLDPKQVINAVADGESGIFFNLWEYHKFKKYCKKDAKRKNQLEVAKELETVNNKISAYIRKQFEVNQQNLQKNIEQMGKVIDSMGQKGTL